MLLKIVHFLLQLLIILVFIHALASWIPQLRESKVYHLIDRIVEPLLSPLRKVIPPIGGLDITPAILIFILVIIDRVITGR